MNTIEEFDVYSLSIELSNEIYKITERFPKVEQYGLTSQLRRAGSSIHSNLAEGFYRDSLNEFIRFINYACGSAGEILSLLQLCYETKLLEATEYSGLKNKTARVLTMLKFLKRSLKRKLQS